MLDHPSFRAVRRALAAGTLVALAGCGDPQPQADGDAAKDATGYEAEDVIEAPTEPGRAEQDRDPTRQTGTGGVIPNAEPAD